MILRSSVVFCQTVGKGTNLFGNKQEREAKLHFIVVFVISMDRNEEEKKHESNFAPRLYITGDGSFVLANTKEPSLCVFTPTLLTNLSEIPTGCSFLQFFNFIDVQNVL